MTERGSRSGTGAKRECGAIGAMGRGTHTPDADSRTNPSETSSGTVRTSMWPVYVVGSCVLQDGGKRVGGGEERSAPCAHATRGKRSSDIHARVGMCERAGTGTWDGPLPNIGLSGGCAVDNARGEGREAGCQALSIRPLLGGCDGSTLEELSRLMRQRRGGRLREERSKSEDQNGERRKV